MTFDPVKGHMTYAGWVIDYCDQVSLKSIKADRRYIRLYGWQKKEELDTLPSQTAYPAGFETSTPEWPQVACWPRKCDRGCEANGYVKVTIVFMLCNMDKL